MLTRSHKQTCRHTDIHETGEGGFGGVWGSGLSRNSGVPNPPQGCKRRKNVPWFRNTLARANRQDTSEPSNT